MTLAALQHAFVDHLHDRPTLIGNALADARGLAVYHHAYRATLRGALRETYPRTALWIGDDAFEAAADAFVSVTKSVSWTLDHYGADFPDHLARSLTDDPEVAELAWVEGAMRRAFAAADTTPIDRASLASMDWERCTVRFAPAVAARTIAGDVPGIWHALGEDRPPTSVDQDQPKGLIVWRAGLQPSFRSATTAEADAICGLIGGMPFAAMCDAAASEGATELDVGGWLARWLDDGLIVAIETQPAAGRT